MARKAEVSSLVTTASTRRLEPTLAWVSALEPHRAGLERWAARRLGDADAARDAVQSAFARVLDAAARRGRPREPLPWLKAVLSNVVSDQLRERRARPVSDAREPWEDMDALRCHCALREAVEERCGDCAREGCEICGCQDSGPGE